MESSGHREEKEPARKWSKERGRRVGEEDGRRVDTFEEGSVDAVARASQWLLRHSSARACSLSKRFRDTKQFLRQNANFCRKI